MRRISKCLVQEHLNLVTICWFSHNDLPAEDVGEYSELIDQIGRSANRLNEAGDLRLALEAILADPAMDCTAFDGSSYGFSSEEMRAILRQTYKQLWPHAPYPPAPPPDVELFDTSLSEWKRTRTYPSQ